MKSYGLLVGGSASGGRQAALFVWCELSCCFQLSSWRPSVCGVRVDGAVSQAMRGRFCVQKSASLSSICEKIGACGVQGPGRSHNSPHTSACRHAAPTRPCSPSRRLPASLPPCLICLCHASPPSLAVQTIAAPSAAFEAGDDESIRQPEAQRLVVLVRHDIRAVITMQRRRRPRRSGGGDWKRRWRVIDGRHECPQQ